MDKLHILESDITKDHNENTKLIDDGNASTNSTAASRRTAATTILLLDDERLAWIDHIKDVHRLNELLRNSADFDERRKIRSQLRKLKDSSKPAESGPLSTEKSENSVHISSVNTTKSRHKSGDKYLTQSSINNSKMDTDLSAYCHIDTEAELKDLLNSTEDYLEKKKIRAAIRELRKKLRVSSSESNSHILKKSFPTNTSNTTTTTIAMETNVSKGEDEKQEDKSRQSISKENGLFMIHEIDDVTALEKLRKILSKLCRELEDTRDFTKRREIRSRMRELRCYLRDTEIKNKKQTNDSKPTAVKEDNLTVKETPDGGVIIENVTTTPFGQCSVKSTLKKSRTESQSDVYEKDTIVTNQLETADGSNLTETDEVSEKRVLTRHGSEYLKREALATRKLKTQSGSEYIHQEIMQEEEGVSMTTGEQTYDRVMGRLDLENVANLAEDESKLTNESFEDSLCEHTNRPEGVHARPSGLSEKDISQNTDQQSCQDDDEVDTAIKNDSNLEDCADERDGKEANRLNDSNLEDGADERDGKEEEEKANSLNDSDDHIDDDDVANKESSGYSSNSSDEAKDALPHRKKEPPSLVTELVDMTVFDGEEVILECQCQGHPEPDLQWYKHGTLIPPSNDFRQTYVTEVAQLKIMEVFPEDEGQYKCVCRNEKGVVETQSYLTVKDNPDFFAPKIVKPLSAVTVRDSEQVILKFEVEAKPQATFRWYKGGLVLRNSEDFIQTYHEGIVSMTIPEVFPDDEGLYKCQCQNTVGTISTSCCLTVEEKLKTNSGIFDVAPVFTTESKDQTVTDGDEVLIKFQVQGTPEPSIVWYKDKKLLKNTEDFRITFDGNNATLLIPDVFPDDQGEYKCIAKNSSGIAETTTKLTVKDKEEKVKDEVGSSLPMFEQSFGDVEVKDGDKVMLGCHVSGLPQPTVIWYKDGKTLQNSIDVKQSYDGHTAKLEISEVFPEDAGVYKCLANNHTGQVHRHGLLTVICSEPGVAPEFTNTLSDVEAVDGDHVTLECNVVGEPSPAIKWYKNGSLITDTTFFQQSYQDSIARLDIPDVLWELAGEYTCQAENISSKVECTAKLTIQDNHKLKSNDSTSTGTETAPTFTTQLSDMTVKDGGSVKFECSVSGPANAEVKWYRGSKLLRANKLMKQEFDGEEASLEIVKVIGSDDGDYTCVCSNPHGEAEATTVCHLSVLDDKKVKTNVADMSNANTSTCLLVEGDGDQQTEKLKNVLDILIETDKLARSDSKDSDDTVSESSNDTVRETTTIKSTDVPVIVEAQAPTTIPCVPSATLTTNSMPSTAELNAIDDEQQLQKLLDAQDDFDERKKIRARLREIKEKKRQQRDKELNDRLSRIEDEAKRKLKMADEEKKQRLERFAEMAKTPTHVRESTRVSASDYIKQKHEEADRHKQKTLDMYQEEAKKHPHIDSGSAVEQRTRERIQRADEEKEKKLEKFKEMAEDHAFEQTMSLDDNTTMTTLLKSTRSDDGSSSIIKQTKVVTTNTGPGGTQFGNIKQQSSEAIVEKLSSSSSGDVSTNTTTSGSVTIKQESWNSKEGLVKKTEERKTWGSGSGRGSNDRFTPSKTNCHLLANLGRSPGAMASLLGGKAPPSGARGAMAAFKKMDNATSPNFLSAPKKPLQRSPSAIKQMLLSWCQAMTKGYEGVNVTNFSSSWSDGLAFCALIHHFCPDAFDFSKLNPKNRRGNFTLAFETAEKKADISPLLEVDDMVRMKTPDWKCVFCYVQSFYRRFREDATPPTTPEQ